MIQDNDLTVWQTSEMAHLIEAINSLITILYTSVREKASLVLKQTGESALGSLISALDN